MATTLGLSFYFHDAAAALVRDGRVVAAAAEERFSRKKHSSAFPRFAIEYCLEAGALSSVNDLDAIVFYEKPVVKLDRIVGTLAETWPRSLFTFARKLPRYLGKKLDVEGAIHEHLPGYRGEILFSEHHLSHAASAFYPSPFERAAVLTLDGVGEWETTTIGSAENGRIRLLKSLHFPHSLGLLYASLTSYLGFEVNDGEWKVMGLAPYGEPRYRDEMEKLVDLKDDGSFRLNMEFFSYHYSAKWSARHAKWEKLFGFARRGKDEPLTPRHADLARSGQELVERIIMHLATEARRLTGLPDLVIAGGVGLNGVANWKIERQKIFERVWIQPAPGDDGAALGAALVASQEVFGDPRSPEMKDAYLGPEFDDEAIERFLRTASIPAERLEPDALVERVAGLLTEGKVVGWFQGRMEFGPRALGSRSILADPRDARMKDIVNDKVKYREPFRPFAPVVPLENISEFFDVPAGTALPFMLKVIPVRAEKRAIIPAVTHQDGSGRVQTVTHESNPRLYHLVKAFGARTGVPVLLNTSFNVRGEPIVCTPEDAYRCFQKTGLEALVLGRHVVTTKKPIAPAAVRSTTAEVLRFYEKLPFNVHSNALDEARELMRANRLKTYPKLHQMLKSAGPYGRLLDVGCGGGWLASTAAHWYGTRARGIDLNPVVIGRARATARLMPGAEKCEFQLADVFTYRPETVFDVVSSLGVLHHTGDCHGAIRRVTEWVAPGGYLQLGLYHAPGRRPFLEHFARMRAAGADEARLYAEFARLDAGKSDETHLRSWFRDQVLHPHESQHTVEEITRLLETQGFSVEATSLNHFRPFPSPDRLKALERRAGKISERALRAGRYYPGFFVVWGKKVGGVS